VPERSGERREDLTMQHGSLNCSRRKASHRPGALLYLAMAAWLAGALAGGPGQTSRADDGPTPEARKPIADRFEALDTDKDGTLGQDEFTAAGDEAARPRLTRDFQVFDLDRDGRLNFDEYLNVPGMVPPPLRGRLPDPIAELVDRWLAKIDAEWKVWDKNGDGELSPAEFAASGLARLVPGLEQAKFEDWNRDGQAGISRDDCRGLLDLGCGLRRADGQLLRLPSGLVFNWMGFKHVDTNHDDQMDHDEYMKSGFDGDQAETRFQEMDVDKDGKVSFAEWNAFPGRAMDPPAFFLQLDTNFDGRVDRDELTKGEPGWRIVNVRHTFPGFDVDGDGFLSLHEYRLTPMANPVVFWQYQPEDRDGDGFLNLAEFKWEAGLDVMVLAAEYLRLLDLNHDGRLDLDEYTFNTSRRDPPRDFRRFDKDRDQFLNKAELLSAVGDMPRTERLLKLFGSEGDDRINYERYLTLPGLVPMQMRGPLPDPIVKLVEREMGRIDELWSAWDKNGDSTLGPGEFQASGLARLVPGLTLSTWKDWDQDGDGAVSLADCRRLLEVAFGVRCLTGEPLRYESGVTINAMLFRHIDQNHDNRLDHGEFLKHSFQGEQAEARFRETDTDHDNVITFAEWSRVDHWLIDPMADFLRVDADLDGRVNQAEFLQGIPQWQLQIGKHVFPGFDLDRDGFLSLDEYRRIPLANFFVYWQYPRQDSNNDGKLSPGDFQWGRRPELACLEAEYFRCLDVNQDGSLDLSEFFFDLDPTRAPRELVFQQRDQDGDGKLSLDEVLGNAKPAPGTKPDAAQEVRLARMEEAFRKADVDHDNFLSLEEFRSQAGLEALNPDVALTAAASAAATRGVGASVADDGERRRMWIIVGGNVVLLLGVLFYVLCRK
jgi:Ca2+-binding EF-hand superfamily protein